mmetsp:Transcript_52608/g.113746  ORF Transcript_52608/g.113746 Transcript_52608/m.113746 type:complete len:252 (+) Transcript_52608:140-895(+)
MAEIATASLADFFEELATRFPADVEDLRLALEELERHKVKSFERLSRFSDSQWQRLDLPLGIENLLREELKTWLERASSKAADSESHGPRLPEQSAQRTCLTQVQNSDSTASPSDAGAAERRAGSLLELVPPEDLEELWQALLEDTVPLEQRPPLQATWESAGSPQSRYLMLLECSSYLRKARSSPEEEAEGRKRAEPLLDELGLSSEGFDPCEGTGGLVSGVVLGIILLIAGLVYYAKKASERPEHMQEL